MKTSYNPNGGTCDACGRERSLRDGMCHECEQASRDAAVIIIDGEEYTPGGFAL